MDVDVWMKAFEKNYNQETEFKEREKRFFPSYLGSALLLSDHNLMVHQN